MNKKIKTKIEVNDLFECINEHTVTKTETKFTWIGATITMDIWHQILVFFLWTQQNYKSEAQVRLYVNPVLKRWGAWAFPQIGETSMTTKETGEVETPDAAKERFTYWNSEPSSDWLYWGTVHHHCSAGAFQSSVDLANEIGQDGIHITVGKLDSNQLDIHSRLIINESEVAHQLSNFFDVEKEINSIPQWLEQYVNIDILNKIVEHKITSLPPAGIQFPNVWKRNYIIKEKINTASVTIGTVYRGQKSTPNMSFTQDQPINWDTTWDFNKFRSELKEFDEYVSDYTQLLELLNGMPEGEEFFKAIQDGDVTLAGLLEFLTECEIRTNKAEPTKTINQMSDEEYENLMLNEGSTPFLH